MGDYRTLHEIFNKNEINYYSTKNKMLTDSIEKLIVKIHNNRESEDQKALLLTSCGSGNGTTAIAINLAISLATSNWNTLLIDLDFRKSNQYKRKERTTSIGLYYYLNNSTDWKNIIHPTNYPHMFFLPSGESIENNIQLFYSDKIDKLIYEAKNYFDFIILDCPSVTVVSDTIALFPKVDKVALIAALNRTTKKQLVDAKFEMNKINEKYCGLIINLVEEKQYTKFYPQYNYFDSKRLKRIYKKWLNENNEH